MEPFGRSCYQSNDNYVVFNVTNTKRCVPIIHKPKSLKPKFSTKTTHYCILFSPEKIPLLALEIYTYLNFYMNDGGERVERLIYVGKADTSGLSSSDVVNVGGFVTEYLNYVAGIPIKEIMGQLNIDEIKINKEQLDNHDIDSDEEDSPKNNEKSSYNGPIFLSETQKKLYLLAKPDIIDKHVPNKHITGIEYLNKLGFSDKYFSDKFIIETKLVLFTRAEGQYIFPESVKNENKHVLDGTNLLKWWLKNTENISNGWNSCEKYLDVLNMDDREIQRYFPLNSKDWKVGNVYDGSVSGDLSQAIYNIPLLPDDPKGRFLEHIVVEGRAKKLNCKRYWQELAIRQEFRFGAVVGLIGIKGNIETNNTIGKYSYVTANHLKQFTELITSKDYSDKSDWNLLYDEILDLSFIKPIFIKGEWKGRKRIYEVDSKLSNNGNIDQKNKPVAVINTLMCVRSKKKLKAKTTS